MLFLMIASAPFFFLCQASNAQRPSRHMCWYILAVPALGGLRRMILGSVFPLSYIWEFKASQAT